MCPCHMSDCRLKAVTGTDYYSACTSTANILVPKSLNAMVHYPHFPARRVAERLQLHIYINLSLDSGIKISTACISVSLTLIALLKVDMYSITTGKYS